MATALDFDLSIGVLRPYVPQTSRVLFLGTSTLIAALILLLVTLNQWKSTFSASDGRRMKQIPGDSRYSRFTNGRQLSKLGHQLAKGDPYLVWNGWRREVVVSNPEHVKDFFGSGVATSHAKPHDMNFGYMFGRMLGQCVGVQSGQDWKRTRSYFNPHFNHGAALNSGKLFTAEVRHWLHDLPRSKDITTKGPGLDFALDALQACRILPFRLVAISCYGTTLTDELFGELLALNEIHERVALRAFLDRPSSSYIYNRLPTTGRKEMDRFANEWEAFNMKIMAQADAKDQFCPAKMLFAGVSQSDDGMSMQQFLQTIDEILFTNIDVTSSVFAFLLINLAAHTETQDELRSEIFEHISSAASEQSKEEQIEAYLTKNRTLLEFTCMESVRLGPPAWFTLPEYSPHDTIVGGFFVPAGTPVLVDSVRLNSDSPVWTAGADGKGKITSGQAFAPQRFAKLSPAQYRYSFMRFGPGPRKCLGKNHADIMTKVFLIELLSQYKLVLSHASATGQDSEVDREIAKIREDRFTITPVREVKFIRLENYA